MAYLDSKIYMTLDELRSYKGSYTEATIVYNGTSGVAFRDDTVISDNIGTMWLDGLGRGWKRQYDGPVNVKWFGAVGDGVTDDATVLQNCFDESQAIAVATGNRVAVRLTKVYAFETPLNVPYLVNLDMEGGELAYIGTDKSQPALTIGTVGQRPNGPVHKGILVTAPSLPTISVAEEESYIGVRILSVLNGNVTFNRVENFAIGIQLLPDPGKSISYCNFHGINTPACKLGLDLRGNTSDGYVNENNFYSSNFSLSSTAQKWGRLIGVRFSAEVGGYTGQNNNRFYGTCFQVTGLGSGAYDYSWSSGRSVQLNYRYYNLENNYEYIVTDLGTSGGTAGTDAPTSTTIGGTFTDNNDVEWTTVGPFFRSPVFHDGAGSNNLFSGSRWESGYGPFAMINGTSVKGNQYEFYQKDGNDRAIPVIDFVTYADTCHSRSSLLNRWKSYDKGIVNSIIDIDLRQRFILGTKLVANGMFFARYNVSSIYRVYTSGYYVCKLSKDSVYVKANTTVYPAVLFKSTRNESVLIERISNYDKGRLFVRGLDNTNVTKDITSENDIDSVLSDATTFTDVADFINTSTDGARSMAVALTKADRGVIMLSYNDAVISGIKISCLSPDVDLKLFTPYEPFEVKQRSSYGTPVVGMFQQLNEVIGDLSGGNGWRVTTNGILCEAWAVSGSVTFDNASDVFTKVGHGFSNGFKVFLKGTAPTGYANQVYYVISATTDTFQLSASVNGAVVNGTTNGSSLEISVLLIAGEYRSNSGRVYAYKYDKSFKTGDYVEINDYVVTFPQNTTGANLIYQVSAKDKPHLQMGSTIPTHTSGSTKVDGITYDFIGYSEITGAAPTHTSGVVGDWEYIDAQAVLTAM